MKNELKSKKRILDVLFRVKNDKKQNKTNHEELILKNEIYFEPISFEQRQKINKKKYRDLKIKLLKYNLENALRHISNCIDLYKELKDRTEFWENKSVIDFDFENWTKIKKVNGRLTRYYNELIGIEKSL